MAGNEQFSLYWNDYLKHITNAFGTLRSDEDLVDVTLSCEGKRIRAHKMILSACSTYFKELFKENPCQHPVIIFRNVKFVDLQAILDFMYRGEVNVSQDNLSSFLTTAELLTVQGLSGNSAKTGSIDDSEIEEIPASEPNVVRAETKPSDAVLQNNNQLTPATSTSTATTIQFGPLKQDPESPPASKRRKRRSNTPDKDLQNEPCSAALDQNSDSDPVEIIEPAPSTIVKMEVVDYDDGARDNVGYGDSSLEIKDIAKIKTNHLSAVGQLLGQDLSDIYCVNSQDSLLQQPADNISLDIVAGQMLHKPGPSSGENDSQDSPSGGYQFWRSDIACPLCGKHFSQRWSLSAHMALHKGQTVCPVCHRVFSRIGNMKRHLTKTHQLPDLHQKTQDQLSGD